MAGRGSLAGLMPYGDANAIVLDMVSFLIHHKHKMSADSDVFLLGK